MRALYVSLRFFAVALTSPIILLCVVAVAILHPADCIRGHFRAPLRIWLGVLDWVQDNPVGYTFWERYEAPVMLDEIAVHHEE